MNTRTYLFILLALSMDASQAAGRVESRKAWTETYPVDTRTPTLEISNVWGDVRVRAGQAGEIVVSLEEFRSAPDQQRFERSMAVYELHTEATANGVALYVGNPDGNWHGSDPCRGCRVEYRFDVLVPASTRLDLSTVNDGDIDVAGVSGTISAANVNGPIAIAELHNCAVLNSVNGAVRLSFNAAPVENCEIETINGDVALDLPDGSGMDLSVDLFNGRMLTQFAVDPLAIPPRVEHIESEGRHRYRIEQAAGVRIGGGGPTFTISSLNGDIRVQKIN